MKTKIHEAFESMHILLVFMQQNNNVYDNYHVLHVGGFKFAQKSCPHLNLIYMPQVRALSDPKATFAMHMGVIGPESDFCHATACLLSQLNYKVMIVYSNRWR